MWRSQRGRRRDRESLRGAETIDRGRECETPVATRKPFVLAQDVRGAVNHRGRSNGILYAVLSEPPHRGAAPGDDEQRDGGKASPLAKGKDEIALLAANSRYFVHTIKEAEADLEKARQTAEEANEAKSASSPQ